MKRTSITPLGLLLIGLASGAPACGSADAAPAAPVQSSELLDDGLPPSCNPLRSKGQCLLPFPSSVYLNADPATETGLRLALPSEALPIAQQGTSGPFDTTRVNLADGFSPSTPILAWFPEWLDAASLSPVTDPARSLSPQSATVLVDMESGELVAHFSELDVYARFEDQKQAVMIHPMARLRAGHRYAVGITDAIRTLDGKTPARPPRFRSLLEGEPQTDAMAQKQAQRMPEIAAALKKAGVEPGHLLLAWDFVTASDTFLAKPLLSMRDSALAAVGADGAGITVTSVEEALNDKVLRRVRGTFQAPRFLSSVDTKVAETKLVLAADGTPQMQGLYDAPFTAIIPACAKDKAPVPIMIFGHGFLGTAEDTLGGAAGSGIQELIQAKCYVAVATDWIGMSKAEGVEGTNLAALYALQDLNHMVWVTDRLQQAVASTIVLARTARGVMAKDAAFALQGVPLLDSQQLYFYGQSLGAILGGAFMAFSPDVARGALNVAGGQWSLQMQRSMNWALFRVPIDSSYRDPLDQQILIALAQTQFDFTDSVNASVHWVSSPLAGTPAKRILMQMSVGDPSVPNLATEVVARTAGFSIVGPTDVQPWGLSVVDAPQPSGLTTWNPKLEPAPPLTNAIPINNGAHDAIQALPALWEQVDHFLRNGEIISTCDGPCDPE